MQLPSTVQQPSPRNQPVQKIKRSNHYKLYMECDRAFSASAGDLATIASTTNPHQTVFKETLIFGMSELGRTSCALNNLQGRDHYN